MFLFNPTSHHHAQGTSVLSPSIPLTLVVLPAFIIAQKSPENIFMEHSSLYIVAFGMVAAKVTNKLVVSMTIKEIIFHNNNLNSIFIHIYFKFLIKDCPHD